MKSTKEFPFERAKRVTSSDVLNARKAITKLTGKVRPKRKGRPPKAPTLKYVPISLRLHPLALKWLKQQAKRKSLPYQTIINELLLNKVA